MKSKDFFSWLSAGLGFLMFVFASYVLFKESFQLKSQNPSVTSLFTAVLGVFAMLFAFCDFDIRFRNSLRILSSLVCLTLSSSVLLVNFHQYQSFENFAVEEIAKLWTLRDSSQIYKKIIRTIAEAIDCCKVHSLVRFE